MLTFHKVPARKKLRLSVYRVYHHSKEGTVELGTVYQSGAGWKKRRRGEYQDQPSEHPTKESAGQALLNKNEASEILERGSFVLISAEEGSGTVTTIEEGPHGLVVIWVKRHSDHYEYPYFPDQLTLENRPAKAK